jgi:glycosyltransferase involved in cell wall biosynthesis
MMAILVRFERCALQQADPQHPGGGVGGMGSHGGVVMMQDGARLHYALPVALYRAGLLNRVYTDWYTPPGSIWAGIARIARLVKSNEGAKMRGRFCPDLPARFVRSNHAMAWRKTRMKFANHEEYSQWYGRELADMARRDGFAGVSAVMGFIRMIDPDFCGECARRGIPVIGDQIIAPAAVELAELQQQFDKWPGWTDRLSVDGLPETVGREQATWKHLAHITCASDYVRAGLVDQGIPPERISVLPYPIKAADFSPPDCTRRSGPVTVGFVGGVSLRKGAPTFLEVAKRVGTAVRFVMVGSVHVSEQALAANRGHVEVIGAVPRTEVRRWLSEFDLFLFPSTCEGSAGSVMEAMAMALPIVTTFNSGSVVRDGIEGCICPKDDADAMAAAIERLAADRSLRLAMGQNSRRRAEEFSIDAHARELKKVVEKAVGNSLSAAPAEAGAR